MKKEKMCLKVDKMFLRVHEIQRQHHHASFWTRTFGMTVAIVIWWMAVLMICYIPIAISTSDGPIPFPAKIAVLIISILIFFFLPPSVYALKSYRHAVAIVENPAAAAVVRIAPPGSIPLNPPTGIPVASV